MTLLLRESLNHIYLSAYSIYGILYIFSSTFLIFRVFIFLGSLLRNKSSLTIFFFVYIPKTTAFIMDYVRVSGVTFHTGLIETVQPYGGLVFIVCHISKIIDNLRVNYV